MCMLIITLDDTLIGLVGKANAPLIGHTLPKTADVSPIAIAQISPAKPRFASSCESVLIMTSINVFLDGSILICRDAESKENTEKMLALLPRWLEQAGDRASCKQLGPDLPLGICRAERRWPAEWPLQRPTPIQQSPPSLEIALVAQMTGF